MTRFHIRNYAAGHPSFRGLGRALHHLLLDRGWLPSDKGTRAILSVVILVVAIPTIGLRGTS